MASRKYIKFGLRADKNLADLNNPTTAIDNVLDDLSSGRNVLGENFSFSSGDILPLRSLMSTDIKDTVDPRTRLPKIFTDLEGSVDEYNADIVQGSLVKGSQIIQPQITLQDRLNRHKIVLGDPPFIGGGPGPTIDFVSSDRITGFCGDINNFTINLIPITNPDFDLKVGNRYKIMTKGSDISDAEWDLISGQSLAGGAGYSDGDYFTCVRTVEDVKSGFDTDAVVRDVSTPSGDFIDADDNIGRNALQSNQLFTKIRSSAVGDLVTETNLWPVIRDPNDQYADLFNFEYTMHPGFRDDRGLMHITGYLGGAYSQTILTNGLLVVEEDKNDDDNWTFLAGTNTDRIEANYSTVLSTVQITTQIDGQNTTILVTQVTFENEEDWKKIALNMAYNVVHTQQEQDPDTNAYIYVDYEQVGKVVRKDISEDGYSIQLDNNLGVTTVYDDDPTNEITDGTAIEVGLTNFYTGSPIQQRFASFTIGQEEMLEWPKLFFTPPRGDERTKVRYSVWWPDSREVASNNKIFSVYNNGGGFRAYDVNADNNNNLFLLGTSYYREQINREFLSQRFSYTYFRDNKSSILRQKGKTRVEVDTKFVNIYQRDTSNSIVTESPHAFTNIDSGYSGADSKIQRKYVTIGERGRIYARQNFTRTIQRPDGTTYPRNWHRNQDTFVDAEIGDHLVFSYVADDGNRKYYSYQILNMSELESVPYYVSNGQAPGDHRKYVDVDFDLQTTTGISGSELTVDGENFVSVVLVKNKGLVGIYKHGSAGLSSLDNPFFGLSEGAMSKRVNDVQPDNILYKIEPDAFDATNTTDTVFDTHKYGFRVTSIGHDNDILATTSTIGVQNHPNAPAGEQAISTTEGIAVVYVSRGLEDNSTLQECTDVFGHEVAANGSAGSNTIALKSTNGIAPGQFVYFDGVIPYDSDNMTVVRSVNTSTNTIELEGVSDQADVTLTDLLPIGVTVVFVPTTAPENGWNKQNKEYCIIPLNTAPPWEGTSSGLASPALNADRDYGVMAKELRFVQLSFVMPEANINLYNEPEVATPRTKYLSVNYTPPVTE